MRVSILGVQIDVIDQDAFRRRAESFFYEQGGHTIVTPNPEFLVAAQRNAEFRSVLNSADLAIPDGTGLLVAARILGLPLKERVTGVEAVNAIANIAAQKGRSLFLLGGGDGVATRAADALQKKYPTLKIAGAESGGRIEMQNVTALGGTPHDAVAKCRMSPHLAGPRTMRWQNDAVLEKIMQTDPDVLFVAFGQVKQELWIRDHLHLFPSVKIAMGVGGTLDYLAGVVSVPPYFVRAIGCEWLWRLVT